MLNAKLVVVGGDAKSGEVRLKLPTVIGRGKEAGLTVPHALVSRRHTELFEKEGRLYVRDLGSLNGTFVNDKRIDGVQLLKPDQLLTLGNVTFRAVYELNEDTQKVLPCNETIEFDEVETDLPVANSDPAEGAPDAPFVEEVAQQPVSMPSPNPVSQPVVAFDETVPIDSFTSNSQPDPAPAIEQSDLPLSGSMAEGNVFAIDDGEGVVGRSVSVSSIDSLPEGQPGVSFNGGLDIGQENSKSESKIDPVKIDLGEENNAAEIVGDSGLGSFLNKLPR